MDLDKVPEGTWRCDDCERKFLVESTYAAMDDEEEDEDD